MNSREFGKSLEGLKDSLKQEIADIDVSIQSAKGLLSNLELFSDQGQTLIAKLTDPESGAEAYLESAKAAAENTDKIYEDAQNKLSNIAEAIASIQTNITEMEAAYEAFTEINDKITDKEDGLDAVFERVTEVEAQIDAVKASADANLASIVTALETVQTNITEMEAAYEAFTEINDKITDKEDGLDAVLTAATEIKDEITAVKANADTLFTEIRMFRDEAANYVKEIDNLKNKANVTVSSIEDQHIESVALKEQIEEIYRIGSQGSQESYFAKRRNQLLVISIVWLVLFLGFLITSGVLAISFFGPVLTDLKKPDANVNLTLVLLRAIILSPFVFGSIYSLVQYSNERRLYEKYAFKTITAASAEGSVATLTRALKGTKSDVKNDKIVEFAVNAFNTTYQEPLDPVKEKIIFKAGNKLLDLTTEVNKSVGKIEDDVDKLTEKLT